jgi:hypothetical protein
MDNLSPRKEIDPQLEQQMGAFLRLLGNHDFTEWFLPWMIAIPSKEVVGFAPDSTPESTLRCSIAKLQFAKGTRKSMETLISTVQEAIEEHRIDTEEQKRIAQGEERGHYTPS